MKTTSVCLSLVLAAVLITGTYAYDCCVGTEKGKCGSTLPCGTSLSNCYKWVDDPVKQTKIHRGCDALSTACKAFKTASGGECYNCDSAKCNSGVSVAAQISLISASAVMVIFTKLFL